MDVDKSNYNIIKKLNKLTPFKKNSYSKGYNKKKKSGNILLNIFITIILSIILSLAGYVLSDKFSLDVAMRFIKTPKIIIMNTLPLTLLMLLVYFTTSRVWISYFLPGSLYIVSNLINRFKIFLRQEPFVPADVLLGNESTNVIKLNELPIGRNMMVFLILFLVTGVLLGILFKPGHIRKSIRIYGMALCLTMMAVSYYTLYKYEKMYDSIPVKGTIYSAVDVVKSKGFVYSFIHKSHSLKLSPPPLYSSKKAMELLDSYHKEKNVSEIPNVDADSKNKKPHVFAIMSEAFFDIDRIPGVEFNEGYNALENYNKILKESYHGKLVTDVFGGGTSNTEFSFLTGININLSEWASNAYTMYIRKDTYSIARAFENEGYVSTFFHPGYPWFYNRFSVYEYLGGKRRFFMGDMNNINKKTHTGYVADMDGYKFLLEDFKDHLAKNENSPYFNFMVTIENHGPYANAPIGYPKILKDNSSFDNEKYNLINNYIGGLMENDKALGYLVDQFSKNTEPVVLLYFGDHLPFLGPEFLGFKAMNYKVGISEDLEAYLNMYQTPYFIWSNSAAKKLYKSQGHEVFVGEAPTISPNYLGSELLSYLNIDSSSYFNYVENMMNVMPVITKRFYKTQNGNFTETLPQEEKDMLSEYRKLQYYILFDHKVN